MTPDQGWRAREVVEISQGDQCVAVELSGVDQGRGLERNLSVMTKSILTPDMLSFSVIVYSILVMTWRACTAIGQEGGWR